MIKSFQTSKLLFLASGYQKQTIFQTIFLFNFIFIIFFCDRFSSTKQFYLIALLFLSFGGSFHFIGSGMRKFVWLAMPIWWVNSVQLRNRIYTTYFLRNICKSILSLKGKVNKNYINKVNLYLVQFNIRICCVRRDAQNSRLNTHHFVSIG